MAHVIDKKVCTRFSDAAFQYDQLTDLHKEIGRRLAGRIEHIQGVRKVLDIGMGTGWFTQRLTGIFPNAAVVGLDFAPGMVSCARKRDGRFKIVQADASNLPFKENVFDVITSNLVYQWIRNLNHAFTLCRSRLNQRGRFYITLFGYETFRELFTALNVCTGQKNNGHGFFIRRLVNKEEVARALHEAGFSQASVKAENIKVHFSDMMTLVKWIKDIGANTLPKDIYMGKDLILDMNQYYNTHFKDSLGVYATFEVVWVEAKK